MKGPGQGITVGLSVVVIVRNEGERLISCSRSVQAMRGDFQKQEIIYANSASTEKSGSTNPRSK